MGSRNQIGPNRWLVKLSWYGTGGYRINLPKDIGEFLKSRNALILEVTLDPEKEVVTIRPARI